MTRLELAGVSKSYGATKVLSDIDLVVEPGEFLVLVGPSGCGKSTLLRIVAGLVGADAGSIRMDGVAVDGLGPAQRDVAMVFQNYALYPHRSVARNLSFPLEMARVPRAERERRVLEAARLLGLEPLLGRRPGQLSGGQMQRVALGRAIVRDPRLFLFDEPLSNLDAKLRDGMRGEIRRLHERLGITTLYVTHDQAEAMTMGSRICVLDGGRIEQVGAPLEVFARPRTAFVAGFIGSPAMNLVEGRAEGGLFRAGELRVPCPHEGGLILGVRPHELPLEPAHDGEAVVVGVEDLGTQSLLELELGLGGERRLVGQGPGGTDLTRGARLRPRWEAAHLHWFRADGGARL